jgi:hypothetical protein
VIAATAKRALLVAATIGAVLIAPGCADDDADEASEPTRAEYTASANEICIESRHAAEAVFQEAGFSGRPTPAEAQRALQALLPVMQESFGGRAALEVPEGEEEAIEAIDDAGQKALAEFERIAAERDESVELMSGQIPDPATEVDRLSGEYGLDECAGKDGEEGNEASAPTKQEWLARANAACEAADKVMNREGRALFADGEPSQEVMTDYALEVVVPAFRRTIEEIRALGAPAGDEAVVERLLTAQEQGTDRVERDPLSIFEDDEPSEADRLAAEYGLDSCGDTD